MSRRVVVPVRPIRRPTPERNTPSPPLLNHFLEPVFDPLFPPFGPQDPMSYPPHFRLPRLFPIHDPLARATNPFALGDPMQFGPLLAQPLPRAHGPFQLHDPMQFGSVRPPPLPMPQVLAPSSPPFHARSPLATPPEESRSPFIPFISFPPPITPLLPSPSAFVPFVSPPPLLTYPEGSPPHEISSESSLSSPSPSQPFSSLPSPEDNSGGDDSSVIEIREELPPEIMAQVIGHKRRGISSGETSASSSSTCQLPTLPGGNTPGTLTDELAALFECPVCFEIVLPPIMQCQVGHLVCASCRPKLSCCPTCRGTLGNIRNLAMEKVANNLMFPCKHKATGCRMSLGLNEKAEHEEICEFRPYSCPCPGASCSWQGQLDKVMVHLQHSHKNITTLNGEDIVFLATEINLAGAVDWVMMQSCFGHHFMLVLEKQEKNDGHTQFFAIVQLIGSRKQAEHFAYRLELNGNRRRLIWEAMPRSSHEGVASAIMASDCLAFDNSIAQHFADNGNLGINVTISLVC